jgi:hypothetical protein
MATSLPNVHFFYDPDTRRLFSSNVSYFPYCGIPRNSRNPVNPRFHLPQYYRPEDPVRSFYHHRRVLETSDLLRSLAFVPKNQIQVIYLNEMDHTTPGWIAAEVAEWTSLRDFIHACCVALEHQFGDLPEHADRTTFPFDKIASTREDAQNRVFMERRYINHLLAIFSFRIFLYEQRQHVNVDDEFHEPAWLSFLSSHPKVAHLEVIGTDNNRRHAHGVLVELGHTAITKYLAGNGRDRVGVFVDPARVGAQDHISIFFRANIPVWFDWGIADRTYSSYSGAYGSRPPASFIPSANCIDQAIRIQVYPSRPSAQS